MQFAFLHQEQNHNWSDEVEVNSLSASKLKLYLKEHGLPVSGGKAALVARVLGAGEAQGKEKRINSNLAVPKTKKIMNNQTIRKLTIMKNKVSRCSSSLTTQWNALQYGE